METSDSREENIVKVQRIELYRTYIEEKIEPLDAVCIASFCKKDGVFSNGDFRAIRNSQEGQQVAVLLDKLLENQTKVNWYGSFKQALRENDLEYVVDYFEGRIRESFLESHFRQILDIHAQKFFDDFEPNIILPLHGNKLFSRAHRDLIEAERTQRERAFKFLTLLQKRPNWFQEFVEILRDPDCGNLSHFAELLQPKDQNSSNTFEDFINFSSSDIFDELEPNDILNRLSHIEETRKNRIQSMPSREKRVIALFEELFSIPFKLWYKEFVMALAEFEKYNHLVDTLNPVEGIKTKKMAQKDDTVVMINAGTYSEGASNNDQVLDAAPVCSPTVDTEEDEDIISDNNYEKHEVEESEKKAFTENPPVCNSNHPDDVTAPFKTPEKTVVISAGSKPELCLREYQDELATPALNGKNSMIVAPTGSGKTFVALKVCIEQLKSRSDAKVIFLVPRVPLVEQQFNLFKKHLPEEEDMIFKVTGEMSSSIPVHISVERHHVTIMTAQILLNILKDGLMTISDISLLIFDECHHAVRNDPYSMIMNCYLDMMKENASRTTHSGKRLPQILGMTASPGMGKAKTMIKAEENITTLMATLDITIAPTQANETVGNLQDRNTASDATVNCRRRTDNMLAYDDSGHVKRERENKIRVEMTDEILKIMKDRDPNVLKSQIRKIQEKLEKDRSFVKTVKEHKEKQKVPDDRMIYKLSCLWCKKTVTSSQHLRHINMQHRVVVDPKFPSLAYFLEVPDGNEGKQIGDDEFVIGKILCKNDKCRRQWGLRMRYKTCPISVLKIQNFLITDERGYRSVKKKWKEVPFNSLGKELDGDDLRVLLRTRVRRDGTMELDDLENEDVNE